MDDADPVVLQLRFRGDEPMHAPPDTDAFCRRSTVPVVADLHARPDEVAVLQRGRPLAERTPLVIFFQHADFGIPAIGCDDECPDLSSWSVQPTVFGWLACVPDRGRAPRRSRAAWVIAACLPLALVSEAAAAPADKGAIQRPKNPRPVIPSPTPEPESPVEPEPAAKPETAFPFDDPLPPGSDGQSAPAEDEVVASPQPPPPPTPVGSDSAIVDAAWEGVDGYDVELRLKGGARMRGRVGAVQRDTFTLIQEGTGAVLVLPKSGVLSLRGRVAPKIPTRIGTGLLVGGGILTGVASPIFLSGVVMLGLCPSCTYIHLPLLIVGAGMLAGGIPMLVLGSRRRQAYRRAVEDHGLAPVVFRTPHGWSGGLRLRF